MRNEHFRVFTVPQKAMMYVVTLHLTYVHSVSVPAQEMKSKNHPVFCACSVLYYPHGLTLTNSVWSLVDLICAVSRTELAIRTFPLRLINAWHGSFEE